MQAKLRQRWLVAAWPGMGAVAHVAIQYLMHELETTRVDELDSRKYFDVPTVGVRDGLIRPPLVTGNGLHAWRHPGDGPDLLLFPGDRQPSLNGFEFCRELMIKAGEHDVGRVVTFAALGTPIHPESSPRVLAVATEAPQLEELAALDVPPLPEGNIGGLNGVLLAAAQELEVEGICLMGEFPFFAQAIANPKSSAAVLRVFCRMAGIELDMAKIDASAAAVEQSLAEHLQRLEAAVDDREEEPVPEVDTGTDESARDPALIARIEALFGAAEEDRDKAHRLKALLDRHGLFKEYEDRFLDLFKQAG